MKTTPKNFNRRQGGLAAWRGRGFSLVEVLIAMGIFAVGFVAVAAMFPAAAILQRETVADVESQMVARNASAQVRTARLTFSKDGVGTDLSASSGNGFLQTFAQAGLPPAKNWNETKLGDRGYPTAQQTTHDRRYYWVPMIRRKTPTTSAADWIVVVFVLRRDATLNYSFSGTTIASPDWANMADGPTVPKVVGIVPTSAKGSRFDFNNKLFPETPAGEADQVRVGDFIADNNGLVYNVTDADSGGCVIAGGIPLPKPGDQLKLWYAPPPVKGAPSPCTRILLLSGVVEEPGPS